MNDDKPIRPRPTPMEVAKEVRRRAARGEKQEMIALELNLTKSTVNNIINFKTRGG